MVNRFKTLFICAMVGWFQASRAFAADGIPVTGRETPALIAFDQLMVTFVREHHVPGAALAIARKGRIIYAKGFGYADTAARLPVDPDALFRIASVSKPITSAAVMQLVERGKLKLTDHPFEILGLTPHLQKGRPIDVRLKTITVEQLLRHAGGFDRDKSSDPMFRPLVIALSLGSKPPAGSTDIIRYMLGMPLDFDPGTREAYSNFGYCVLGRVIEKVSGASYGDYVRKEVLAPLGIHRMRLGRSLESDRAAGEVRYYSTRDATSPNIFGGMPVYPCYGGWNLEAMDANGGWIASAPELAQFASSFDNADTSPILNRGSIEETFARPAVTGYAPDGKPTAAYYADGWMVRPITVKKANTWHAGLLDGTSSLLVRRYDGITWAVLFNTDRDQDKKTLADLIDPLLHPIANSITAWPTGEAFKERSQ